MNLGGAHDINDQEKCGSKREKVIGVIATIMISKMVFRNQEAVRTKIIKTYKKSKKLPKNRSFWLFGTKSQGYTFFLDSKIEIFKK